MLADRASRTAPCIEPDPVAIAQDRTGTAGSGQPAPPGPWTLAGGPGWWQRGPWDEGGAMPSLVADVMTTSVVAVRQTAEFKDIVEVMRRRQLGAFPVLDAADRVI